MHNFTNPSSVDDYKLSEYLISFLHQNAYRLGILSSSRWSPPAGEEFRRDHDRFARTLSDYFGPSTFCISTLETAKMPAAELQQHAVLITLNNAITSHENIETSQPLRLWLCNQMFHRTGTPVSRLIHNWLEGSNALYPVLYLLPFWIRAVEDSQQASLDPIEELVRFKPVHLSLEGNFEIASISGSKFDLERCCLVGLGLAARDEMEQATRTLTLLWLSYLMENIVAVVQSAYERMSIELKKSKADLESARYEAGMFHSVLPDLNIVRIGHRRLNEPFACIERQLFPMSIFLPRLGQLTALFTDKKPHILAEGMVIEGMHDFPEPEMQDDVRWKNTAPLCAAAVLRMLGLASLSMTPQELWGELQRYLQSPDPLVPATVAKALRRHLPEIFRPTFELDDARRLFTRLKAWLHSSSKLNRPDMPQSLDLSLLLFALDCSGVGCHRDKDLDEDLQIWVGSTRPIEVLDALDVMHGTSHLIAAQIEVHRREQVRLELEYMKPFYYGEMDWTKLHSRIQAFADESSRVYFTAGDLVTMAVSLLGQGKIMLTERRLFRAETTGSVGLEWLTPQRLCIDWTVRFDRESS